MIFDITQDEANTVLNALAAQPYGQVFQLIAKLQQQGQEQLNKEQSNVQPN